MTARVWINSIFTSVLFALWQRGNPDIGGFFMFSLLGFVLSAIDYAKSKE